MTDCRAFVLTRGDFLTTKPIVLCIVDYLQKEGFYISISKEVESYSPIPKVKDGEDQSPL